MVEKRLRTMNVGQLEEDLRQIRRDEQRSLETHASRLIIDQSVGIEFTRRQRQQWEVFNKTLPPETGAPGTDKLSSQPMISNNSEIPH